jgi:predicted RNA-binding protein with PUA-like domain
MLVDVRFVRKIPLLPLAVLRAHAELAGMRVLARGNRLSITPVSAAEWQFITTRLAPA